MSTIGVYNSAVVNDYLNFVVGKKDEDNTVYYPLIYSSDKPNTTTVMYPSKNGILSYQYKNLSADNTTIKTIVKYYYYKLLDKWLYRELMPLLAFIEIKDGEPKIITNLDSFDPKKLTDDSVENIEKRIDYMEKIIITKDMIKHVLKKMMKSYNMGWYDLKEHDQDVKKYFYRYIKEKLQGAISSV